MEWKLQAVQGDDTFVLVSGEYFKRCSFNTEVTCQGQIHIPAQADRKITCRRLNACSDQDKCCENELLSFISTGSHFIACGNNADYPKCFVFDDTMKRQEELDFHSVNIRRGRHKSWIDLWRSNEIFQMISLTVKPNRHLRLSKVNNYRNTDHTIIESGDLGVKHERDLKVVGAFNQGEKCNWSDTSNPACLTSLLYVDQKQRSTYLTSMCKNDPGTDSQTWNYFERNKLKCCDRRFDQQDDYTCSTVATTAVQYGEFVYAVFKPKMTLTSGMETSFLCRLQLPSSQTCDFTSPSQKINQGKTLILDRLANIDRQLRLVSFSQIDQSTVFLGHYKKGDRQGQLAWLQLKNSTLSNIGYYKANPYSQIIASNDTVLYDDKLIANPKPKCSMKSTGAAKYDCLQCSRSDNPFCSGYDGNTCSSKGEHNCAKIPIYRNTYTVPRTVLILDTKALLLKVKLTIDQSKFVDIINTELTVNWSMKKGEYGNSNTPYYELNQSLSPTHNICNDEQSVYLTTWSTVNDPVLVSEEQFKIKNECQDLREESILLPPPPTPPSIRTTRRLSVSETTPNLPTVSIFVSENGTSLSDALSTGSIETTMAPSQVVQLAEASILGKSVLVISVLVVGILIGFTLGCCVGRKRKKYSMGKHARAP